MILNIINNVCGFIKNLIGGFIGLLFFSACAVICITAAVLLGLGIAYVVVEIIKQVIL